MSLVVDAMGVAVPGYAQDATADEKVEEVIVSGQRLSVQSAQVIKRESSVIVDSILLVCMKKMAYLLAWLTRGAANI